jgi:hypothetical protein
MGGEHAGGELREAISEEATVVGDEDGTRGRTFIEPARHSTDRRMHPLEGEVLRENPSPTAGPKKDWPI